MKCVNCDYIMEQGEYTCGNCGYVDEGLKQTIEAQERDVNLADEASTYNAVLDQDSQQYDDKTKKVKFDVDHVISDLT